MENIGTRFDQPVCLPRIRIIENMQELNAFEESWEALCTDTSAPMQRFQWTQSAARTFAMPDKLCVMVVQSPQPVAVLPLVRRGKLGCLELLSVDELYEPMDALYADQSAAELLAAALIGSRVPFSLNRLPAESFLVSALERIHRKRGIFITRPVNGCSYVPLDHTWIEPERHLNSGRRSDLRRARRIAERAGSVRYEILSPKSEELESLIDEAFLVEAAGWKGRAGTDLLSDTTRGTFYKSYAAAACEKGILRLCFLRIDDQIAAMQIAVECGGRFWLLKIGYHSGFSQCSPGTLLMLETMRYAAQRDLSSYEFLGGVESWLEIWTQRVRPSVSVRFYPAEIRGGIAAMADAVKITSGRFDSIIRSS